MQVPAVPTFVAGDISVAKLQQLSQCVSFVSNASAFPMWHLYGAGTSSISASTWTNMNVAHVAFDSDHVFTGGPVVTIQTVGYYVTEACIAFISQASSYVVNCAFLWTAGPNNPHFSSGTTQVYGLKSGRSVAATGQDETICIKDICPNVCYPGDTLVPQAFAAVSATLDFNNNPSGPVTSRFVPNFTGRMIRCGS